MADEALPNFRPPNLTAPHSESTVRPFPIQKGFTKMSATQPIDPGTNGGRKPRRPKAEIDAEKKKQDALAKAKETRLANKLIREGRVAPAIGQVTQLPAPTEANAAAMAIRARSGTPDPVIAGLLVDFPASCASLDKATAWLQVAASTFTLRGLAGSFTITAKAA